MEQKRILIVEDDAPIREVLSEILQLDGYEVLTAGNGEEGLRRLAEGPPPHLILLDLMMPVKDGFTFRSEQRKNPQWREIPVIVLSANSNLETRVASMGEKIPFLKKPVDLEVVLETVRNCVDGSH